LSPDGRILQFRLEQGAEPIRAEQANNPGKEMRKLTQSDRKGKARITPQLSVQHSAAQRGITIEEIGVAPIVILSWGTEVIRWFADTTGAQECPHWLHNERHLFFTGEVQGRKVSFAQVPVGAPGTVMLMEEMIACGARLFLGLGWAGSLQPYAPVGSFLIPLRCIREEGTSSHYVGDDIDILPDARLAERLLETAQANSAQVFAGPHWTTDAPYREFDTKIDAYRQQGVLGVDMETSAMYVLGSFRNVAVCNLLIVSDELWQDWNPAFRTQQLRAATKEAQRVMLRVLADSTISALITAED
jgi:uridine phosphorylase